MPGNQIIFHKQRMEPGHGHSSGAVRDGGGHKGRSPDPLHLHAPGHPSGNTYNLPIGRRKLADEKRRTVFLIIPGIILQQILDRSDPQLFKQFRGLIPDSLQGADISLHSFCYSTLTT